MHEKTIALIGLDTSHTLEFTRLMQQEEHRVVQGMRAVKALRFPSPFQAEEGQDKRQAELEALGVRMAATLEEAIDGVDAIFLEINDPAQHLHFFEKVVGLGRPIFIDKPLCASTAEASRIQELAAEFGTPVWSASSLRFIPALAQARAVVPRPEIVHTFGALGRAAAGSDLVWYGVHAVEMLVAAFGIGASRVRALEDSRGVTLLVDYADGRRGLVECLHGLYRYGGRLQSEDALAFFDSESDSPYVALMSALRDFVVSGAIPVPLAEAVEVMAILEAGDRSLASGTPIGIGA